MSLGFGGPSGKICRDKSAEVTDIMLVRLEHRVDITDAQKAAFEEFKTATRVAADKLREGCPKKPDTTANEGDKAAAPKVTPLDRLAQTQVGLEASLEALKTYRPAAEKFYASLSDEQKAKLTERRGGGKRHWKRDRGPHDGGERDDGGDRGGQEQAGQQPHSQRQGLILGARGSAAPSRLPLHCSAHAGRDVNPVRRAMSPHMAPSGAERHRSAPISFAPHPIPALI